MKTSLFIISLILLLSACGKKVDTGNFNTSVWKDDRLACKNLRSTLITELEKLKPKLEGISESELERILGKPDANSLADQGEHYYYYYLESGPQCQHPSFLSSANKLVIRVNAMNLVSEVTYEQPLHKL